MMISLLSLAIIRAMSLSFVKGRFTTSQPKRVVVDAFIFYNELQMLNFRLHELNDVVDIFVIVEANLTFQGKPKPMFFAENKHLFEKFLPKIVHVVVDDMPVDSNAWGRERFQRNAIVRGINRLSLKRSDILITTNADEIPDATELARIKQNGLPGGIHCLNQVMYYYNPTCRSRSLFLYGKIMEYGAYLDSDRDIDRMCFEVGYPRVERGGWHFSYFGGADFIKVKLEGFSHAELNTDEFKNKEYIEEKIREGKDLFGRDYYKWDIVPIHENTYLPKNIHMLL